jgi:hypothetical protein
MHDINKIQQNMHGSNKTKYVNVLQHNKRTIYLFGVEHNNNLDHLYELLETDGHINIFTSFSFDELFEQNKYKMIFDKYQNRIHSCNIINHFHKNEDMDDIISLVNIDAYSKNFSIKKISLLISEILIDFPNNKVFINFLNDYKNGITNGIMTKYYDSLTNELVSISSDFNPKIQNCIKTINTNHLINLNAYRLYTLFSMNDYNENFTLKSIGKIIKIMFFDSKNTSHDIIPKNIPSENIINKIQKFHIEKYNYDMQCIFLSSRKYDDLLVDKFIKYVSEINYNFSNFIVDLCIFEKLFKTFQGDQNGTSKIIKNIILSDIQHSEIYASILNEMWFKSQNL